MLDYKLSLDEYNRLLVEVKLYSNSGDEHSSALCVFDTGAGCTCLAI